MKDSITSTMTSEAAPVSLKMADDDDLNFENDDSLGNNSSVACKSSQSSTTSSLLSSKYGRTKSQRRKARLKEQAAADDEDKIVRFSLSPGRDSLSSALSSNTSSRRRRRKKTVKSTQSSNDEHPRSSLESRSSSSLGSPPLSRSSSLSSRQSQSPQRFSQDSSLSSRSSQASSRVSFSSRQYSDGSLQEDINVRGAGIDVLAVQDAGSYRMLFDDASYLCSTITSGSPASALDAACDLALLLANPKTRAILLSVEQGGAALAAILETLSAVTEPDCIVGLEEILGVEYSQGGDYDLYCGNMLSADGNVIPKSNSIVASKPQTKSGRKRALQQQEEVNADINKKAPRNLLLYEALASVIHFLSWDCTANEHSSCGNASKARQVRSAILEHPTAVRCACNLVLMDLIVEDMLSKVGGTAANENGSVKSGFSLSSPTKSDRDDNDDASRASSIDTRDSMSSLQGGGLTSAGRKRRRKKRRIQVGQKKPQLEVIAEDQEFAFPDSPMKPPAVQVDMHMSFTSDDESLSSQRRRGEDASVSTAASEQVAEKLSQLRTAVVQPDSSDEDCKAKVAQHTCGRASDMMNGLGQQSRSTSLFVRGDFVLRSLSRIIEGKEGEEVSCIENEAEGDGDVKRSSQDAVNEQEDDEEEQLRKNPLLITNTLLRKGGTLPTLARAMAETLSAVIVSLSAELGTTCIECLAHLKQRVTVLASLIDGACCLTSENRKELCGHGSHLLSSILLFLKTFSDTETRSPTATNLLDEIALSTLRTLTSLTHDNGVARSLLMMSYKVDIGGASSVPLPGVLILANLLWKTVTNSKQSQLHSAYDMVIFCLNTLSNAVEAKNLRRLLADYKVPITDVASAKEELFLTWLSRWLFLETTSFRSAVMQGTFGQKVSGQQDTSHEMRHLEKDDEEHLITAGNGFIFMTCLMIDSKVVYPESDQLFTRIRQVILKELQVEDDKGPDWGLLLMKNTLKAFCNFYHYSLGDLSVAIVAPVGQLIVELDRMQLLAGKTEAAEVATGATVRVR